MKKSILLVLAIPLLLASCDFSTFTPSTGGEGTEQTGENGEETTGGGHSHVDHGGHSTGGNTGTDEDDEGEGTGGNTGTDDDDEGGGSGTGGNTDSGGGTQTQSTTVTKQMSQMGFVTQKNVTEFKMADDLTVTLSKGQNTQNQPKYYDTDGTLRIYGKNTMTFTCDTSKITKIVFQITTDSGDNDLTANTGSVSSNRTTWTGSANSITFTVGGSSGKICITSISVTYGGSGTSATGGGGDDSGGGNTDSGGGSGQGIQAGNGNTSHSFTSPWTGIEYDIVYSMFKGNLPHLSDFNKYALGNIDGSTIPYFNPYEESNWSKSAQDDYDKALKEMGYSLIDTEPYEDEDGNIDEDTLVKYYQKGTYYVQTSHYAGDKNVWYFDVYAYNEYQAPFELDYTPTVDLNSSTYKIGKGNKSYTQTINGITFKMNNGCENKGCIQIDNDSSLEITSNTALSKMDISFFENSYSCLVYAGSSSSNAKIVYNDGSHFEFPSGTKYVKLQALNKYFNFDDLSIK